MNDPTVPTATATATATATDAIRTLSPGWKQIVMVCKVCEKRSNGPKKFGAKKVAHALLLALRQARQPKTRVVQTSCLGLCPKRAVAVAACAPGGAVHVIAWHKRVDAGDAWRVLFGVAVVADPVVPAHREQR
jgi:predicted metal-binding protein